MASRRCDGCRHWEREPLYVHLPNEDNSFDYRWVDGWGECTLARTEGGVEARDLEARRPLAVDADSYAAWLITPEGWYCSLWEEKDEGL